MDNFNLDNLSSKDKEKLVEQLQTQMMLNLAQDIVQKMVKNCFSYCVPKPGSSLSSAENKCLAQCSDRFMDVMQIVGETINQYSDKP